MEKSLQNLQLSPPSSERHAGSTGRPFFSLGLNTLGNGACWARRGRLGTRAAQEGGQRRLVLTGWRRTPEPSVLLHPQHTDLSLSLKVLLMTSIRPHPPQHRLLPPPPLILRGPRRDHPVTLPKYKCPLLGRGWGGLQLQGPALASVLVSLGEARTGGGGEGSQGSSVRTEQVYVVGLGVPWHTFPQASGAFLTV